MSEQLYNVAFIGDSFVLTTSVYASEQDDAISSASYVIEGEMGVVVNDINCRVEVTLAGE
jgi:hypothetical protein